MSNWSATGAAKRFAPFAYLTLEPRPGDVLLHPARHAGHRRLTSILLVLAAVLATPRAARAQNADLLRGRIVTPDSQPVVNAIVRVTSNISFAVRELRTDTRGRFSLMFQNGGGDYMVSIMSIGITPVELRVRREGDEEVLLVDVVVRRIQSLAEMRVTETQRPKAEQVPTEIGAAGAVASGAVLPVDQQGDLNAIAAALAGFALTLNPDGSIAGFSALGLDPSQNVFTLNGQQVSSSALPRDAAVVTRVNTTTFDASKGHFSGASVNSFAMGGGPIQQHSMRLTLDNPAFQAFDRRATSLVPQSINFQASGNSSGEIVRDRSNYNVSWQAGRRISPLNTLLDADSSGLARLGLTADSVARYEAILRALGVPFSTDAVPPNHRSENVNLFGRAELNLKQGGSVSSNIGLSHSLDEANALSARALPSYGGRSENTNGNAQVQWSGNLGASFLDELQFNVNVNASNGDPFLNGPAASVVVSTLNPDGGTSLQSMQFGGNQNARQSNTSGSFGFDNTLSWFNGSSRHRLKFQSEATYDWYERLQASNQGGTFVFNSLADLENGVPASFVRRLGTLHVRGDAVEFGGSLTDTWRKTNALQFQLGLRGDAVLFPTVPQYNAEVDQLFGLRTDHAPNTFALSPRIGFTWTIGTAPASYGTMLGPSQAPRLSGGIGRFASTPNSNLLGTAIDETGLPSGAQQLTCTGPAVPAVNWKNFLDDPQSIPTACADGTGAGAFTVASPRVTVYDRSWQPTTSWRANLSFDSYLTRYFRVSISGQYSDNEHQNAYVDRNFAPTARFTIASEGNRPVFVDPSAISTANGAVSLLASRRAPQYAQVSANLGDGRSRSEQLTIGLSPVQQTFNINPTTWNISWTTVHVRDKVRGFGGNTAGDPLEWTWGVSNGDIAHQINANIRRGFGTAWSVNLNLRAQSGQPFTPIVGGDVNGDGLSNDRAFVFDPAHAPDSATTAGMKSLLASANPTVRGCLLAQMGHIADRGACRAPWSVGGVNATVQFAPREGPLGDRVRYTLNLTNLLTGLDLLWHHGVAEGWGQSNFADPTLLYVRGFDPVAQRFTYEVNQRFGETRSARSLPSQPFRVTLDVRVSLGPALDRQMASIELRNLRRPGTAAPTVASIKQRNVTPATAALKGLVAQKDSLALTKTQIDSINTLSTRLARIADSVWTPMAERLVKEAGGEADAAITQQLKDVRAAVQDAQFDAYRALRTLLTDQQKKKLKPPLSFQLTEEYMRSAKLQRAATLMGG